VLGERFCHVHRARLRRQDLNHVGAVNTVVGNGESGFAAGSGAAARFHFPADIVVDGEGTIVVVDQATGNQGL